MSKKNIIIALALLVIVVGGGVFWMLRKNDTTTPTTSATPSTSTNSSTQGTVITYDGKGFSPSTLTAHSGDTITLKNTSSGQVQFDSDPHPIHTNDPELNVGEVSPGQSATFKVITKGTHGYHNHLNPGQTGTIVVD